MIPEANPFPAAPQTQLSIQSNAATVQLFCARVEGDTFILAGTDGSNFGLIVPTATFPYLRVGEPVLASVTLTRVAVEPIRDEGIAKIGLVDPNGRRLS